jgi:hypothetical protein
MWRLSSFQLSGSPAIVFAAAAIALPGWLVVGLVGLGALSSSPEQGFCGQPLVPHGTALVVVALAGLGVGIWTLRHTVAAARGRQANGRHLVGLAVILLLAAVFVILVVPLSPEREFVRGPC